MAYYQSALNYRRSVFIILLLLAPLSFLFALAVGSVSISWPDLWAILSGHKNDVTYSLVMELRLPRASVGALGAMLFGFGGLWLNGAAFCGALLSMVLVFSLAHGKGSWTPTRLILTGVVVAAGWGALISFILAISPDTNLRGMLFWLIGDLSHTDSSYSGIVILLTGIVLTLPISRHLNILSRGELKASALGVPVSTLRIQIYFIASLLTASAVTIVGNIGFVGLIVPHLVRLVVGNDQRILIPAAVLLGASLLVIADTVARTVMAPTQLPIGVITALIGVPVFLYLLQRSHH
jgi:iron complex transport system permease protein